MDIQADIIWIQSELTKVKDPELISAFKNLLKFRAKHIKKDWWDVISDEEKNDILEGVKEIEEGNFLTHEEVMENPRKWS
ncbi:MAG: hypothetical protein DRJ05_16140 [Bacteroidetes bacterium]|nr:MAG: hypothetical protein DRJ05_16140 [Bacteroidota bacterium]